MSRWRIVIVAVLLLGPILALAGVGWYFLWTSHWGFVSSWLLAGCFAVGYWLVWHWHRKNLLLRPDDTGTPTHWTDRDGLAWELVQACGKAAAGLSPEKLTDPQQYLATAQEMAAELAVFYHPKAQDPVGKLTIPELLAVVELAAHDLAELVDRYMPGGHMLRIDDFRRAQQVVGWYESVKNISWAVSALFSPINTGLKFAASRAGMSLPWELLRQNLLVWFYTAYIHRLGTYLIDLNSGRLRVGAARYRELKASRTASNATGDAPAEEADGLDAVPQVTVTLLGQVKAGKSSLINALLGERRAQTDVLPATDGVERYQLQSPGIPTRLVLLDTVGYGHAGPKADQVNATRAAAQQSDLLLLVVHSHNPARQPDLAMLEALKGWFADRPDLKRPPVLVVMTHIDLLSPSLEWNPPYAWQQPTRLKEESIRDAAATVKEQFGERVAGVVPVCTATKKVYGIEEGLLPAVAGLLDESHGVSLLRVLQAEANTGKVRKVFRQLLEVGKGLAGLTWEKLKR